MSIQTDLKAKLVELGISQKRFCEIVGVNQCALSKFLKRRDGASLAERLVPYVYGGKPIIAHNAPHGESFQQTQKDN